MAKKKTTTTAADKALPSSAGSDQLPVTPRFQQMVAIANKIAQHEGRNYVGMEDFEAAIRGIGETSKLGQRFTQEDMEVHGRNFLLNAFGGKVTDDYCRSLGIFIEFTHYLFQNND